eukprot:TRINITY_DN597_c1_g1_i3.p1 TRINITY_DN597_c1_g1~~TRINITY_DN597_c1_g1_i3.p1  ORF type:complete len:70 (+),score=11.33 TRINITY_DN597_c1_g1_i3:38-247(+)
MNTVWNKSGVTFLRYSNLCAQIVRSNLSEPYKTQSEARERSDIQFEVFTELPKDIPELLNSGESAPKEG